MEIGDASEVAFHWEVVFVRFYCNKELNMAFCFEVWEEKCNFVAIPEKNHREPCCTHVISWTRRDRP